MRADISTLGSANGYSNGTANGSALHKVDVVIVGGGFSGCYMLHKLRQQNFSVRIVEAAPELGGVWQWNCYPGARVDTHVPLYEYSIEEVWKTWTWQEKFPTASELQRYFRHVDNVLGLSKDVIYNTKVTRAIFDDSKSTWTISTDKGSKLEANFFIPAVGFAAKRSFPNWAGLDDFKGIVHHSSFWPANGVDLAGKRVAVVGTGSTGVQIVQEIGPQAGALTLFQRTPNLALPLNQVVLTRDMQNESKPDYPAKFLERLQSRFGYDYSHEDINTFDHTPQQRRAFYQSKWDQGGFLFWVGAYQDLLTDLKANREAYDFWAEQIRGEIKDPKKRDILAPSEPPHPFGTKRPALFRNFYKVCDQDNVTIVDTNKTPVTQVVADGIITEDAKKHDIDVLILATGFDAITGGLKDIDIRNDRGETLSDKWSAGTWTNLGLMTAEFPNMYFMYGPQGPTGFSNGPTCIEIQGEWIINALTHMREKGVRRMAATPQAQEDYRAMINDLTAQTLFPLAKSYYMGANIEGKTKEALNFPSGIPKYRELLDESAAEGYKGFVLA